jgi:hypothetical protein
VEIPCSIAEQLKAYVKLFHPRLIGLTGDARQIRKLISAYKEDPVIEGSRPRHRPHGIYLPDGPRRRVSRFLPARRFG